MALGLVRRLPLWMAITPSPCWQRKPRQVLVCAINNCAASLLAICYPEAFRRTCRQVDRLPALKRPADVAQPVAKRRRAGEPPSMWRVEFPKALERRFDVAVPVDRLTIEIENPLQRIAEDSTRNLESHKRSMRASHTGLRSSPLQLSSRAGKRRRSQVSEGTAKSNSEALWSLGQIAHVRAPFAESRPLPIVGCPQGVA